MTAEHIETARLILRLHHATDAEWIAQEIAHPEVHRMLTMPPRPYRLEDARDWIDRVARSPFHRVIVQDDTPLGVVTCDANDRDETLGYWLRRSAWGRGIMTEAASAMLAAHFKTGAEEATSGYIIDNPASARVLTKMGFVPGDIVRRHSRYRAEEVSIRRMHLSRTSWHALSRA